MRDSSHRSSVTALCGPHVLARLHTLCGETVEIVTLRLCYRGTLLAVNRRAVWLEFDDGCSIAITEPIVTVAPRPGGQHGATSTAHPAVEAS